MNDHVGNILRDYKDGLMTMDEAIQQIESLQSLDLGFANIDFQRKDRCGAYEVIYCASKMPEQIVEIARALIAHGQTPILLTRLSPQAAQAVQAALELYYDDVSHIGVIGQIPTPDGLGKVAVVTAGTSDIPVAQEAVKTLEFLGNRVESIYDVGVAGIHRLFAHLDKLRSAQVVIAVAGMEGALASVVAGLVDVPVIAVPTSVGYGAAFEGVTALLAMINSCAAGVSVVNIDNGFGAACIASRINHQKVKL